ncbi:MAG: hypothetical protein WKF35_02145 [Ferruginibacter sp.]
MNIKNNFYKLSHWETWDYLTKYFPIMPVWFWYCLKARSLWFFTPSNPGLTFGGFEGESKKEMYDQLPPGSFPRSIYITPVQSIQEIVKLLAINNLSFPFAVKPDVGMMGFLFRKISNIKELSIYHAKIPVAYIIQELITYPMEVSVFYYRYPWQQSGKISGFLKKESLQVTGDGKTTVRQLIQNYDRVRFRLEEMYSKHYSHLENIVPVNEIYYLSYALNLSRGGQLISLAHEIDDKLLSVFDDLSHYTKSFYYGRYDIKCAGIQELREGKEMSILEFNGCGAEPHHAYGNGNTLIEAYRIFLHHWKVLYTISRYNHKKGIKQWGLRRGLTFLKKAKAHFKKLKHLDSELYIN